MNRCVTTYGELMDMLDKELSGIHFLIQVLPGVDFDLAVFDMMNDALASPKKFAEMISGGRVQLVHPDEARWYHASTLMQVDGHYQSYIMPVTHQSRCLVEAYEGAAFFQILDGDDN